MLGSARSQKKLLVQSSEGLSVGREELGSNPVVDSTHVLPTHSLTCLPISTQESLHFPSLRCFLLGAKVLSPRLPPHPTSSFHSLSPFPISPPPRPAPGSGSLLIPPPRLQTWSVEGGLGEGRAEESFRPGLCKQERLPPPCHLRHHRKAAFLLQLTPRGPEGGGTACREGAAHREA